MSRTLSLVGFLSALLGCTSMGPGSHTPAIVAALAAAPWNEDSTRESLCSHVLPCDTVFIDPRVASLKPSQVLPIPSVQPTAFVLPEGSLVSLNSGSRRYVLHAFERPEVSIHPHTAWARIGVTPPLSDSLTVFLDVHSEDRGQAWPVLTAIRSGLVWRAWLSSYSSM